MYPVYICREIHIVYALYLVYAYRRDSHVFWARARFFCIMRSQIPGIKRWAAGAQQGP